MKDLNSATVASLAAEATSLCSCWRFERTDGQVFGATDHDRDLSIDGVAYASVHGLAGARFVSTSQLSPGSAAARGALDAEFMTEQDLALGLWDRCRVDVFAVDWKVPDTFVEVWSGRLSDVARTGEEFTAELLSLKVDLDRTIGRVFQRSCDASVGDARCKIDLSQTQYRFSGPVTEVLSQKRMVIAGLSVFAGNWFRGGRLLWVSGENSGSQGYILHHGGDVVETAVAARTPIAPGDAVVITSGCDKSFEMCGAKFSNRDNFRGFPHMPGNDAILSGPGVTKDGSKRR